jgi:Beta-galactosidase/beta-glucuronidase
MIIIPLDGEWRLKYSTGQRGGYFNWPNKQQFLRDYPAQVPGTVQQAMEGIVGETTLGRNSLSARWIEEMAWNYTRTFTLTEAESKLRARAVFEGLDLTAAVYINGQKAGWHNNFYTPCRLDITNLVHAGENTVTVVIDSGLFYGGKKSIEGLCGEGEIGNQLTHRMWLRKPQSSFEWDWSPRLINVGIYKTCRVELTGGIFADETALFAVPSDDYTQGNLRVRQFITASAADTEYTVTARVVETGDTATFTGKAPVGQSAAELNLNVKQPKLWYPVNYGEQALYTIELTVSQEGCGDIVIIKKTGFRKVVIDQSKHPEGGNYFNLIVNGVKVFAKGGNMIPADIIFSRLTRDVYKTLIDRAVEANFSMLRVWGGGIYETDDFYELCDERGIMVWQDFINACASYPGYDDEYYQNYRGEVTYSIRRLSRFPSLVIYAGNNELIWLTAGYGGKHYPDAQLYHWLIPKILRAEGEERYYQPSSPYSFDSTDDNSDIVGDQHPWFIGFSDRDYYKYRTKVSRFPNEGGMLGPTSLPNMNACFSEGQDYMHSFDWELHDNSISHNETCSPDLMLSERLNLSTDGMSVRDYTYYGGFCHGEALTEYILNFRRRMYNTSSAIFWMYNDCWPATRSWTIVDYLRNRTPAFCPVKRAFAPVTVDIVRDGGEFVVYGISERLYEVKAELEYGAFSTDGKYQTQKLSVTLAPNISTPLARFNTPDGYIPYSILAAEGEPVARRHFIEKPYNELGLIRGEIKIERIGTKAVYTAEKFTLGVCIDLDGDTPIGDNFFDLFPGKPYEVELAGKSGDVLYAYQG